jgi:hypothetical protein
MVILWFPFRAECVSAFEILNWYKIWWKQNCGGVGWGVRLVFWTSVIARTCTGINSYPAQTKISVK